MPDMAIIAPFRCRNCGGPATQQHPLAGVPTCSDDCAMHLGDPPRVDGPMTTTAPAPISVHRPYAHVKGSEPSVTTAIGVMDKAGLAWGAAKETATFAVHHPDEWTHLEAADAVERLRTHHRGVWDGRAAMGTLAHSVLEVFAADDEIDIAHLVQHTIETDRNAKSWKSRQLDDVIEQALGYVLGIEAWWADYVPTGLLSEVVVRTPGKYIGQTDLRCTIASEDWLIDAKSTAQQAEGKGVYADSWTAQLNAYAFATETVEYAARYEGDKLKVEEIGTGPWTPPQRLGVLHLRGDESYSFYEIPLSKAHHDAFLSMVDLYQWRKAIPNALPTLTRGL